MTIRELCAIPHAYARDLFTLFRTELIHRKGQS